MKPEETKRRRTAVKARHHDATPGRKAEPDVTHRPDGAAPASLLG